MKQFMIITTSKDVIFSLSVEIRDNELRYNDTILDLIYVEQVVMVDIDEIIKPFI